MNSLNQVIKACKHMSRVYKKENMMLEAHYYEVIVEKLLLENKYKEKVLAAEKPLYHYFMYHLPVMSREYFEWLYNPYNPVRLALETMDSVEEIRNELNQKKINGRTN